jgi:CHAT domain-containing protein
VGAEATEALFRRRAPVADRIHVAAHGRVDRVAPARTHLILAPGEGQDGRLEAAEIAELRIEASLVVLSGCATAVETGLARGDAPADDLFGLPRAFLAAGAGHVVAGLWEMDDDAGRAIMPRLYRDLGLRDAPAAIAALQREIVSAGPDDVLRGLDHPYYWAGIVVYGAGLEARAPSRSRSAR